MGIPATAFPSLEDALSWLAANDPKTAATYCAADGTVEARRKRFNRRPNGTIVGFHDGAQPRWESYPEDVRVHVARRMAVAAQKAQVATYMQREQSERTVAARENVRRAVAALREFRTSLLLVPEAHRELVAQAAAAQEATLAGHVNFFWSQR